MLFEFELGGTLEAVLAAKLASGALIKSQIGTGFLMKSY
jgi:hypothetical protein